MTAAQRDRYAATERITYRDAFRGVVRDVYTGKVSECKHAHKTRSGAIRCAEMAMAAETPEPAKDGALSTRSEGFETISTSR